jgi:hypothetical protein
MVGQGLKAEGWRLGAEGSRVVPVPLAGPEAGDRGRGH